MITKRWTHIRADKNKSDTSYIQFGSVGQISLRDFTKKKKLEKFIDQLVKVSQKTNFPKVTYPLIQ